MKEKKVSKEKGDDLHKEMLKRFDLCVSAESDIREDAAYDVRFVNIRGQQWDDTHKKARQGRPCYEFGLLRQHCRQVTNDQRQARPAIKVRAVEASDKEGADLRQGLIRNIESVSNAATAYDTAFKFAVEGGFGVFRINTRYSDDLAWEQEIFIEEVQDPFGVWFDPSAKMYDRRDAMYAFDEISMSRDAYAAKYPEKPIAEWETGRQVSDWFRQDDIRLVRYWMKKPCKKTVVLLSNGKTVEKDDVFLSLATEMAAMGITIKKERTFDAYKVCSYIANGMEFISGPHEWAGKHIPLVPVYGDLITIDGRERWSGMVRHAIDAQKLLNYNLTTAQETIAKQPKSPYLVTAAMLEGKGVKAQWDKLNATDVPYLPYTPDPNAPAARPTREPPPDFPMAFANMGNISTDLLKSVTGIHDASLGQRSNETSGKAIIARQREGDTANYNYQDNLSRSIQYAGEILIDIIPKYYDTERVMRILGPDGAETYAEINKTIKDPATGEETTINDLSEGKFDVTVSTGPSFSSQRQEFNDLMMNLAQSNPDLFALGADLFFESLDVPFAEKLAERAKAMLPPEIQKVMQQDKEMPPEVKQAMAQVDAAMQQVQAKAQELEQQAMELQKDAMKNTSDKSAIAVDLAKLQAAKQVLDADFAKKKAEAELHQLQFKTELQEGVQQQTQSGIDQTAGFLGELMARNTEVIEQQGISLNAIGALIQDLATRLQPPEIPQPTEL